MLRFVCAYDEQGRSLGAAFLNSETSADEAYQMGMLIAAREHQGQIEIEGSVPPPEVQIVGIGRLLTDEELAAIGDDMAKGMLKRKEANATSSSTSEGTEQSTDEGEANTATVQ
jgi:hypothetical protein